METTDQQRPLPGLRQFKLKKFFKLCMRSLLTSCSQEDFSKIFSNFSQPEQRRIYRVLVEVISSLHGNIEDEFETTCLETKAYTILDTVEQLVQQHSLDSLSSEMTPSISDVWLDLSKAKEDEIENLTDMLEKAEKENSAMRARIDQLRKEIIENSVSRDGV
ncbi:uncharacterized protein LOC124942366 [Impatiens glandulifera]|uniref:uncharacterized protein LOC124942366 n=1 Tax=Impatiens glandulifera TaxID=253017 RepID=UPI001FB08E42|nr:uncharacterized protein LOC124942366 [Impatiens glandulifera]